MTPEREECDVHGLTPDEHCSVLEACLQEVPGDMLEGDGDQPHDAVERLRLAWEAAERRAEEAERERDAMVDGSGLCVSSARDLWRHRAEAAEAENRRLREALDVIATCPAEAVHLMPLAAQAALAGEKKA